MKQIFQSLLLLLTASVGAMADEVQGVTVEYTDAGTAAYVQAISAIGRIEFADGRASIVFKDEAVDAEDLGALTNIKMISFGIVNEDDISKKEDTPTVLGEMTRTIEVSVYPNPTADHIHISGMGDGQTARLFTSGGILVCSTSVADINLGGMPAGVYILQGGKEVVKIIKK